MSSCLCLASVSLTGDMDYIMSSIQKADKAESFWKKATDFA